VIHEVNTGRHRFSPGMFGLVRQVMTRYVRFDYSCKYLLDTENQLDINKLFGIGYFPHHHKHSVRFGWRWSAKKQMVEIFAYVYSAGLRHESRMVDVRLGSWMRYTIHAERDFYALEVVSATGQTASKVVYVKPSWKGLGYKLSPYFGGNKTAPHKMRIEIRKTL
jgi:hypothetical protein